MYLGDIIISFNHMDEDNNLTSEEFKKTIKILFTVFYIY